MRQNFAILQGKIKSEVKVIGNMALINLMVWELKLDSTTKFMYFTLKGFGFIKDKMEKLKIDDYVFVIGKLEKKYKSEDKPERYSIIVDNIDKIQKISTTTTTQEPEVYEIKKEIAEKLEELKKGDNNV